LDIIKVKGKSEPVWIYEVYGLANDPQTETERDYYQLYEEGFEAYRNRDFKTALEQFNRALKLWPDDAPCLNMISRIDVLDRKRLPVDWDGSVALDFK
jgi:adenylate cyclase